MSAHDIAIELAKRFSGQALNEADTRHQVIDPILHDVLAWPRTRVRCELKVNPGYADYVLLRADDTPIVVIEAKREGAYFDLPAGLLGKSLAAFVQVKTLQTTPTIASAIAQVRDYCTNIGCNFAAVTNGHQWIFFRTYIAGQDWRSLRAYVVRDLEFFAGRYVDAINTFGYSQIADKGSLRALLLESPHQNRELFYPKDRVNAFGALVDANSYASSLRPIAENYFGNIDFEDSDFTESCYVSYREYDRAFADVRQRIEDSLTPFLEQYGIENFHDKGTGGKFVNRLAKSVVGRRAEDVVVLFGGKGVGKSTFLKRLFFHKPPHLLEKNAVVAFIDLLNAPPNSSDVRAQVWSSLNAELDRDQILSGTREGLCRLFQDRFDRALKQDLTGFPPDGDAYNSSLNLLLRTWMGDTIYVAERLSAYWRGRHKGIVVVLDNTDQLPHAVQESCFTLAKEVAERLGCLVVIAMREERFAQSSIHGVLDAYQTAGFHITAPEPAEVFVKRLEFVQKLLSFPDYREHRGLSERTDKEVVSSLFRILANEFTNKASNLTNFLTACSHGDIRHSLALFRGFLVSGYTNVSEITSEGRWTLQSHQVIKPFLIPTRFFYDERMSKIPNVYQIRSKANGSHFTSLRILQSLFEGHTASAPAFVPVGTLANEFVETFGMREDFEMNLDLLLKHRMVEANSRVEEFCEAVDSIRITPYGAFMLKALSPAFTYLEVICPDCAISDQSTANGLSACANDEYAMYVSRKRLERVQKRLEKADLFLQHLLREEEREIEAFRLHDRPRIAAKVYEVFKTEKIRVMKSAIKNTKRPA